MSALKKLVGQTAVYGLSSIVGRFLNYLLVPLYTNPDIFSTDEYGIVTDIFANVGFLLVLLTYGMETAFFRYAKQSKNPLQVFPTAITPLAITSGLFILLMFFFSDGAAAVLKYPGHGDFVLIMAIVVATDAFVSLPFAKLRLEDRAVKFAAFKFINIGINIGLNLFFILLLPVLVKNNPDSIFTPIYSESFGVGYIFVANLVASLTTLLLFVPSFFKIKFSFSKDLLQKMLRYGWPLLFAGFAGMVNEVLDRILLKYFLEVPTYITAPAKINEYIFSQIGIYGANYKLSVLITLFIQAFRYAAEPFFFSQKDRKDAKKTYAEVMKYFLIFSLAIFLLIMLYLDIFRHFIGKDYWEGLVIVPILLLANLFLGAIYNLSVWYKLTDRTRYGMIIAGIGAGITVILNIILIPEIGYLGSAWATFFCYLSMMLISFFLGRKYYPVQYELKRIGLYAGFAVTIFFIHYFVPVEHTVLKYMRSTLLMGIFIAAVLYNEGLAAKMKSFIQKK